MKIRLRAVVAGLATATFLAGSVGVAFAFPQPPYEPDPASRGSVGFYDASGKIISVGSITHPLAAFVVTSGAARSGDTKATLIGARPEPGTATSAFANTQMSASTAFPITTGPSNLNNLPNGIVSESAGDITPQQLETNFPHPASDNGTFFQDLYQIRVRTSGPTTGTDTLYWEASIRIDNSAGTWSQVWPAINTATGLTVSPASPQQVGTQLTLTAMVTPASATGTVQFVADGTTNLGSPVTVSSGTATTTNSSLAVGSHNLTAVFTPGDPTSYVASTSPAVPYTVTKASPSLSTQASATTVEGGQISDMATLTGGFNPSGTIAFKVYGPGDTNCATALATSTATVGGNGVYNSAPFTTTGPGTYQWVATYGGDGNNNTAASLCGDTREQVVVTPRATTTLTTQASGSVPVGGAISDSATLAGGNNPSGTITFKAYGPGDTTCATPLATSSAAVSGNGVYNAASLATSAPGSYQWVASYSGDTANKAATTSCGDVSETVTVTKATPTLRTQASASTPVNSPISDTATLVGGFNPTGTITFNLYGPNDATCATSVFTSTKAVSGNGWYTSGSFTPGVGQDGTYRWIATYSGDANNTAPAASSCSDPNESVVVTPKAQPTLTTRASASVPVGGTISDTATLGSGSSPTGTIAFTVYGSGDTTCTTPLATSRAAVSGNGSYSSAPFTATTPGTYRWVASYGGDSHNLTAGPTACNDPNESVTVTPQTLTGRAFGASASLLGNPVLAPTPDTGSISTTSASNTTPPCAVDIPAVVIRAQALCASIVTSLGPSDSTAQATAKQLTISIPSLPVISVQLVQANSDSQCAGSGGANVSTGSTTIVGLTIGGIPQNITNPSPNTTLLGFITLDEQVPVPGGLTVNGLHVSVPGVADVIVSSATSDIHNCP